MEICSIFSRKKNPGIKISEAIHHKKLEMEEKMTIFSFPITTTVFLHYGQKLNRGKTKQRVLQDVFS